MTDVESSEPKRVMLVGAVIFFGAVVCLAAGYSLAATHPDPQESLEGGEDPDEILADLNDRARLGRRFIDIGQPLAPAGAALLVAGALLPRAAAAEPLRRLLGMAVVVGAAIMALIAGLVSTEVVWEDGFSSSYRVWSWIEVASWVALAIGMLMLVAALREGRTDAAGRVEPAEAMPTPVPAAIGDR